MRIRIGAVVAVTALSLGLAGFTALPAAAEEVASSTSSAADTPTTQEVTSPSEPQESTSDSVQPPGDTTAEPTSTTSSDEVTQPTDSQVTGPSSGTTDNSSASPSGAPAQSTPITTVDKHPKPVLLTEWNTFLIKAPGAFPLGHVSLGEDAFTPRQTFLATGQVQPLCGQYAQQDNVTGTREDIDEVIAAGIGWANGHADDNNVKGYQINDWVIVYGGDCAPPKPDNIVTHDQTEVTDCKTNIVTTHHTTTTIGHTLNVDTNTWVEDEPVTTNDEDTTRPSTLKECPAVIVPPVTPPASSTPEEPQPAAFVTESVPQLAETGSDLTSAWIFLGASLLAAGVILTFGRKKNKYRKTPYVD